MKKRLVSILFILFNTCLYASDKESDSACFKDYYKNLATQFGPYGYGDLKLGMKWKKNNALDRQISIDPNQAPDDACLDAHLKYKNVINPFVTLVISKEMRIVKIELSDLDSQSEVEDTDEKGNISKVIYREINHPCDRNDTMKYLRRIHTPEGIGFSYTGDVSKHYKKYDNDYPYFEVKQNKRAYYQIFYSDKKREGKKSHVSTIGIALKDQRCFG